MAAERPTREGALERRIGALAARQGGNVTRRQLLDLGAGREQIDYRVRVGRLIVVHRGVYAVGHPPSSPIERGHAALLACGERSALSHGWAAAYWGTFGSYPRLIEVSTPLDRRPPGLRVHVTSTLTRGDVTRRGDLRVTSPARTIFDIAPRLSDRRLTRAINDLRLAEGLALAELHRLVARIPRHPAVRRLRPILAIGRPEPTRSELEDAFERFAREADLPPYELNVHICGHRVDFYFPPPIALIVEVDGWQAHRTREQFVANRRQDAEILAGTATPTVRLVYDDIALPALAPETAARLLAIVAQRRAQAANR